MSCWKPRRVRLAALAAQAATVPLGVDLRLPEDCPPDVRQIARQLAADGPRLLIGQDPAAVGLLASRDRLGRPAVAIVPLEKLWQMATRAKLARRERPGWFHALIVGDRRGGIAYLATPSQIDRGAA